MFVGVSDNGDAFGLTLQDIDKTKNLVAKINDRHIFPHVKIGYMLRSTDENAERFVLAIKVQPSESIVNYRNLKGASFQASLRTAFSIIEC